ncbi:MAG: hypothetical protein ACD_75C00955G0002 [uncultured bacterium]|nr:MAG: hypothetical protein ACD_75C00955G0002 [uncultured bacterium]
MHIFKGIFYIGLVNDRLTGVREDLVDPPAGHDVAGQKNGDVVGICSLLLMRLSVHGHGPSVVKTHARCQHCSQHTRHAAKAKVVAFVTLLPHHPAWRLTKPYCMASSAARRVSASG